MSAAQKPLKEIEIGGRVYRVGTVTPMLAMLAQPLLYHFREFKGGEVSQLMIASNAILAAMLLHEHANDVSAERMVDDLTPETAKLLGDEWQRQMHELSAKQGLSGRA